MPNHTLRAIAGLLGLLGGAALLAGAAPAARPHLAGLAPAAGPSFAGPAAGGFDEVDRWSPLRRQLFGERPIRQGVVEVVAPPQADDAALVPITVRVPPLGPGEARVKAIHLFVDWNPDPVVVVFRFGEASGATSLSTRIRIQTKSAVRAVAEMADGTLYMDAKVVKAAGGCSAPVGKEGLDAKRALGEMRLRTDGEVRTGEPARAQLLVRHPQYNGLQRDVATGGTRPPDFITRVTVRYDADLVFEADTSFALSTNPSFHFSFVPRGPGSLAVRVEDTEGRVFEQALPVTPAAAPS